MTNDFDLPRMGGITRRTLLKASVLFGGSTMFLRYLPGCQSIEGSLHEVVDMEDRKVILREQIDRVYCSNATGTTNIYFLAPELLIGWNYVPLGEERIFLPDRHLMKKALGSWREFEEEPDIKEIVSENPDVIFCYDVDDDASAKADAIQNETGIPAFALNGDINMSAEAYHVVGRLLGEEERAGRLAEFVSEKLGYIKEMTKAIPATEGKRVYFAQGEEGLLTKCFDPPLVSCLEIARMTNVSQDWEGETCSIRQVEEWNPDCILANEYCMSDEVTSKIHQTILTDPAWQAVPCVKQGKVYRMPRMPFAWFGLPSSVLNLLGMMLVLKILYPEYMQQLDVVSEARVFYSLFFDNFFMESDIVDVLSTVGVDVDDLRSSI